MWNLTSRPLPVSPPRWAINPSIAVFKEELNEPLIIVPDERAVIPSAVSITSRLPPKKRFLEAAAQQQQQQEQLETNSKTAEDNSALMHLAEMCVYYQKSGTEHLARY